MCEALMADRAEYGTGQAERYLAQFHVQCARVGAGAAMRDRNVEDAMIAAVEAVFLRSSQKENRSGILYNKGDKGQELLLEVLSRWKLNAL
jgi:hypothetical protein